jgi:O-antigen ligase
MFYGILIASFLIFFAYLSWRNLFLATTFIIAFLPTYLIRFNLGFVPFTLLEGMILVLFGVWVIKSVIARSDQRERRGNPLVSEIEGDCRAPLRSARNGRHFLAMTPWNWLIILWLIIATISMFVSPNLRAAAGIWKAYFIEPILFLTVFLDVIKTKKDLENIFYALGFSALYISLFAIYQKFTGFAIPHPWQEESVRRVTGFYGFPNAVGLYLAPIIVLYVGLLIDRLQTTDYRLQIFKLPVTSYQLLVTSYYLSVIILSTAAIIFAQSEGAYIGVLAGVFFLGIMTKKLRLPTLIFSVIFTIIIISVPQLKDYAWRQISFQEASGKVRIIMWEETIEMLKDRPILGAGLAGYQETFDPYHKARHIEIYLYPHNLFLNFWSELGLLGLILFLAIIAFFFYSFYRLPVTNYQLPAVMLALLVHGLVDAPYFKNDLSILFWIIIGASILLNSKNLKLTDN